MLINILINIHKYQHHKHIIDKLKKSNIVMPNLEISDKGGCLVRDAEVYTSEMNKILRSILKG